MQPSPRYSSRFLQPARIKHLRLGSACRPVNLLLMMLMVELMVVLISLIRAEYYPFFQSLALLTIYYQAVLFLSTGIVCHLRHRLALLTTPYSVAVISVIVLLIAALVAWVLRYFEHFPPFGIFLWQSQLSCLVLTLFLLRHQYLLQQRYQQLSAQISARLETLQAYIRPHFLFNALNNLAAMIQTDGRKAEELVLAMAFMLRYVLRTQVVVGLDEELEFIRQYLFIEQTRLGKRLEVKWNLPASIDNSVMVPMMIFQPLLENAISHGPAALVDGGTVEIDLSYTDRQLCLEIRNHAPSAPPPGKEHHHISIENIQARLDLLYDGQARFECGQLSRIDDDKIWWISQVKIPRQSLPLTDFTDFIEISEMGNNSNQPHS